MLFISIQRYDTLFTRLKKDTISFKVVYSVDNLFVGRKEQYFHCLQLHEVACVFRSLDELFTSVYRKGKLHYQVVCNVMGCLLDHIVLYACCLQVQVFTSLPGALFAC